MNPSYPVHPRFHVDAWETRIPTHLRQDSLTGTWSYNYDNLNRLTSGASSAGYFSGAQMSWTYDPFGNRLSQSAGGAAQVAMPSPSTASYTAASNQMTAYNGFALAYDAAGDVTQDALNSYLYDAEGRICAVKTAGPSYTGYIYDAAGTRVAKGSLTSFSCNFGRWPRQVSRP